MVKSNNSNDVVKTSITDLMKDVNNYFEKPEKVLELFIFLDKFPNYSMRNRLLIEHQRPGAIAVASFKKYRDMGYSVKPGEKAIKVLVPVQLTKFYRNQKAIPLKYATKVEKSQIKAGKIKTYKKLGFIHGNVFDVSQTNLLKDKYPELYPNRHIDFNITNPSNQKKLDQKLGEFAEKIGYKVKKDLSASAFSNIFGNAKGVTIPANRTIYLNPKNTPTEKINNLMHELGHAQLHANTNKPETSRPMAELQAQLTSYLVAKNYGIDNHDYTVQYIANWTDNGKKLNQLEPKQQSDILSGVTKAADNMIDFISGKNTDLQAEQTKHRKKESVKVTSRSKVSTPINRQAKLASMIAKQNMEKSDESLGL